MDEIKNTLKKILAGGIGAVATAVEKGEEMARGFVEKGEETLRENQETIDSFKEKFRGPLSTEVNVKGMTREERDALRKELDQADAEDDLLDADTAEAQEEFIATATEKIEDAADKAEEFAAQIDEKIEEVMPKVEELADEAAEKIEDIMPKVEEFANEAREKIEDAMPKVEEFAGKAADQFSQMLDNASETFKDVPEKLDQVMGKIGTVLGDLFGSNDNDDGQQS